VELCFVEGVQYVSEVPPTDGTVDGLATVLADVFWLIMGGRRLVQFLPLRLHIDGGTRQCTEVLGSTGELCLVVL
jgi:hypothetical protein